jgi:hypothetical protein
LTFWAAVVPFFMILRGAWRVVDTVHPGLSDGRPGAHG